MRLFILVSALLLFPALAHASCKDPQYQQEMNACAYDDYMRADKQLNVAYTKLVKKLDASQKEKLRAAQRAWIAFRDTQCTFEGSSAEGGSMQPMLEAGCKASLTEARTKDLINSIPLF